MVRANHICPYISGVGATPISDFDLLFADDCLLVSGAGVNYCAAFKEVLGHMVILDKFAGIFSPFLL